MSKIVSWNLLYSNCSSTLSVQEKTAGNAPHNGWLVRRDKICQELLSLNAEHVDSNSLTVGRNIITRLRLLKDGKVFCVTSCHLTFHGKNENGLYQPASFDNIYVSQDIQFVNDAKTKSITACLPDENNPSDHTWIQVEVEFPSMYFVLQIDP